MSLVKSCCLVVTDSEGLQEETTYLGVPWITVRETTEWPITVTCGTNRLVRIEQLAASVYERLREPQPRRPLIALWDGRTAGRIVDSLRGSFFARQL
jgi:UDP-N-acetylglucosamine 2-epimerase (non-hydrolysing)